MFCLFFFYSVFVSFLVLFLFWNLSFRFSLVRPYKGLQQFVNKKLLAALYFTMKSKSAQIIFHLLTYCCLQFVLHWTFQTPSPNLRHSAPDKKRGKNCNSGAYAAFLCKYSESRFKVNSGWKLVTVRKSKTEDGSTVIAVPGVGRRAFYIPLARFQVCARLQKLRKISAIEVLVKITKFKWQRR